MNCVFCNNESQKRYHIDCLDEIIEVEFGTDIYDILLERSAVIRGNGIPYWLETLIGEGVSEGRRNITRFKIFANLQKLGVETSLIEEKIWEFNSHCHPPDMTTEVEYHIRTLKRRFEAIERDL